MKVAILEKKARTFWPAKAKTGEDTFLVSLFGARKVFGASQSHALFFFGPFPLTARGSCLNTVRTKTRLLRRSAAAWWLESTQGEHRPTNFLTLVGVVTAIGVSTGNGQRKRALPLEVNRRKTITIVVARIGLWCSEEVGVVDAKARH